MSLQDIVALAIAEVSPRALKAITILPSLPSTAARVYGSGEGWHQLLFYLTGEPTL